MSSPTAPCKNEAAVAKAVRTGRWTAALREHHHNCPTCAEVALIAGLLQQEAAAINEQALLPDPELLWLQAQLRARREATRRATRAITIMQLISGVCAAGLTIALLLWQGPTLLRSLAGLLPGSLLSATPTGMAQPWLVLTFSAGAIIFLLLLDRTAGLARE